jgi:uncharacterized delta-60 repeat protein
MAVLGLGIDGRLEEGETLTAWGLGTAGSWGWQALVNGAWVNVGSPGSSTYVIPAGAAGTAYRLAATSDGVTTYSPATGAAIADTRKVNAPYLTGPAYAVLGWEDPAPRSVFSWLTFSDADKGNYGGGSLLLQDSTSAMYGGDGHDMLGIRFAGINAGQFSYNAATREVRYAFTAGTAVTIGTVDAALTGNGTDFKVVFNNNATVAVVNALVQNLQYTNTDDSPTPNRLFTLRVTDPTGASAQRVTAVGIENTPDAPVFTSAASASADENQTMVMTVSAVDPDRETGEPQGISYSLAAGAGDADNGRFVIDAETGTLRFGAAPDFEDPSHSALYSVRVRATDGEGSITEQVIAVALRDVNDAPVATGVFGSARENGPAISMGVTYSDQDANDQHTITFDATGTVGSVSLEGQSLRYDPAGRFEQLTQWDIVTDTFTYTVTDAAGASSTQTATVWLRGENDPATMTGTTTAALREDSGVDFGGYMNASGQLTVTDIDRNEAVVMPATGGNTGPGSFLVSTNGWSYRVPNSSVQALGAGETLVDSLVVTSWDGTASQELRVSVAGANDAPLVVIVDGSDKGSVAEAGAAGAGTSQASGTLFSFDLDAHDTVAWSGGANGTYGRFDIDSTGHWTYVLDNSAQATQALGQGQTAVETFTATVRDTGGGAVQQQVKVTVTGSNDAPVIGSSSELAGLVQEPTIGSGMLVLDLAAQYGRDSTAVDAAGRLVVLGEAHDANGYSTHLITRLHADGSADGTFGNGGTASVSPLFKPSSVAVDTIGRYVVAGYSYANYSGSQLDWAVERHHPDGSLDTTFGNGGLATFDFGGYDQPHSVDVSATGRLLVSGYVTNPESGLSEIVVLGLDASGAPDMSFGTFGRVVFGGSFAGQIQDFTIDGQGRLVGWGFVTDQATGATQLQVVRYLEDGSADTSFGNAGSVALEIQGPQVARLALGSDGQILVGWTEFTGDWNYLPINLALLRPDGSLETGFGGTGRMQTGLNAETLELSFDAQGRPLVAFTSPVIADFQLARFNPDGTPDTSFHIGGTATADLGGEETVEAIHFLQTGEVLVAGTSWQDSNLGVAFASFDQEGNLNTAFGEAPATALTTSGTLFVVGNGWDNGDTAQWTGSAAGQYGEFQLSSTGTWTYVLDVNNPATQALEGGTTGTEHFVATVTDSYGASASCEVVVTVVGSYDPPAP